MAILLDESSRVCVQGITGFGGRVHTQAMLECGTRVVAGVSPGHAGKSLFGIPIFDSCRDAMREQGANFSVCFVGGQSLLEAGLEAVDAGIDVLVCTAEAVTMQDSAMLAAYCAAHGRILVGPNTNGVVSPGIGKAGFFPEELMQPGQVGVVSRSGSLSYGVMQALQHGGMGVSTALSIGGGQSRGIGFVDCLERFAVDDGTRAVVVVGEVGGRMEEDLAEFLVSGYAKPVVALVAGRTAPEDVAMGHAGAIATATTGRWEVKVKALASAGASIAWTLDAIPGLLRSRISQPGHHYR